MQRLSLACASLAATGCGGAGAAADGPAPSTVEPADPPPVTRPPLPAWSPAAGEVSTLTVANGGLANNHNAVCAPYFDPFYFGKIVNAYSGYLVNEHYGTHGALVGFGGGHANTNDNTVWGLVLDHHVCTFRRLVDPSPIFGSGDDPATRADNSNRTVAGRIDTTYGEYLVDGKPCASHSYGSMDILGPAEGGAACGSFVRVVQAALTRDGGLNTAACHQVDFADSTGRHAWRRRTARTGPTGRIEPAQWSAWVPAQRRIYFEARHATAAIPPRWFDLANDRYVEGTGRPRANDGAGPDTGVMFHVPERGLLVFADRQGSGHLRLQYLDATRTDPSWVDGVALDRALPVIPDWGICCWCPDNARLVAGGIAGDDAAVYEIEIPVDLRAPWRVVRAPFGAGQSIRFSHNTYKKWTYNRKTRSILYMPLAAEQASAADLVWVYRPRGT